MDHQKFIWSDFGDNGYAKIKIGDNICGIEDNIHYAKISWDSWCGEGCDECNYDSQNKNFVCNSCISDRYDKNLKKFYKCREGCESYTVFQVVLDFTLSWKKNIFYIKITQN